MKRWKNRWSGFWLFDKLDVALHLLLNGFSELKMTVHP